MSQIDVQQDETNQDLVSQLDKNRKSLILIVVNNNKQGQHLKLHKVDHEGPGQ